MNIAVTTHPDFAVVSPTGRLTATVAPRLRQAIDDLIAKGFTRIVIDLAATEFIDSSGLGAVIGGLKATRVAGGDLRIATVSESVRRVLKLTNLDRVLRAHPTPETAFDGD
ncbi:STAS domain-containing protein [Microbacterium sp. LRZ72]|uniref:STAS domain-containing protein n=1 Tax=Microbacterium sp. LRZ72 TaxID=2942481 RepID=UPI0029BB0A59|nr:STAS domain-containing protein [Microbacterium sp. LRZ72]MDX2377110.1 STAS domain-containing protein [Microbacterium sp. LRZ72]